MHRLRSVFTLAVVMAGAIIAASAQAASRIHVPKIETDTSRLSTITDPAKLRLLNEYMLQAQRVAERWYVPIVHILGAEPRHPPRHVVLWFDPEYGGVAETAGDRIRISTNYVASHPDDLGMIVHELAHVVQAYNGDNPGWLVEGIADYVRWFNYEPEDKRPHPRGSRADARASYRTTAAFLNWARRKYDPNLVKQLNRASQDGRYTDDIWQKTTGKTLDQLNEEWKASLAGG